MVTVRGVLKSARRLLLAEGWAGRIEPICHVIGDCRSKCDWCNWNDEGVVSYGVWGALCNSRAPRDVVIAASKALEAAATPAFHAETAFIARHMPASVDVEWVEQHPAIVKALLAHHHATEAEGLAGLDAWLASPSHNVSDVLQLFDEAIGKAGKR